MDNDSLILPFTFFTGISLLVLSTSNRLQFVNSIIRDVLSSKDHLHKNDMPILLKRMCYFQAALVSYYISIALLCVAVLVNNNDDALATEIFTYISFVVVIFGTLMLIRESFLSSKMLLSCKRTKEIMQRQEGEK